MVRTDYIQVEHQDRATPYLRIARYDKTGDDSGNWTPIHQKDMLQTLGLPPQFKYQSDGGPSLKAIAELLRAHVMSPEKDIAALADWQILNYLLGNWDGHAKNLSLLYEPGEEAPTLAPFYDIVSIEYLNVNGKRWDRSLAFAIGEHHSPDRIRRADWESMARDLGMQPDRLLDRLEDFANRLPGIAEQTVDAFAAAHGDHQIYRQMPRMV